MSAISLEEFLQWQALNHLRPRSPKLNRMLNKHYLTQYLSWKELMTALSTMSSISNLEDSPLGWITAKYTQEKCTFDLSIRATRLKKSRIELLQDWTIIPPLQAIVYRPTIPPNDLRFKLDGPNLTDNHPLMFVDEIFRTLDRPYRVVELPEKVVEWPILPLLASQWETWNRSLEETIDSDLPESILYCLESEYRRLRTRQERYFKTTDDKLSEK